MKLKILILAFVALFLASCASMKFSMMKDDELIAGGVKEWNAGKFEAARAYWSNIQAPTVKSQWMGYLDQKAALDKTVDDAAALPVTAEPPLVAGWNSAVKASSDFPSELKVPADVKSRLAPVAKAVVRLRLNANRISNARDFMKSSSDFLGDAVDYAPENKELAAIADFRTREKGPDDLVAAARGKDALDDKIDSYEAAIAEYGKVEAAMADIQKAGNYPAGSIIALASDRTRRKRADTRNEMERTLRNHAYEFKDRIGEEFARQPDPDKVGNMTLDDMLAFNQQTKANMDKLQAEVVAFAAKYPRVIDKDMLKDVETQKQDLLARIAVVTAEIEKAKKDAAVAAEIASRGKALQPMLIGMFNPVPGAKGPDQKSRPAKFRGAVKNSPEYWWGMVEIPKGVLNDLVITVDDSRPVRVFNENTKSGKDIDSKKLKDLVNRQYKVGNSWPVINAGTQLTSGKYFFELGKTNDDGKYSGDAVVYSSFVVRMR
jgi:hypothetical protein